MKRLLSLTVLMILIGVSVGYAGELSYPWTPVSVTFPHLWGSSATPVSLPQMWNSSYPGSAFTELGDFHLMYSDVWDSAAKMGSVGDISPGVLRTWYEEASASGMWNFEMSMSYQSVFPSVGMSTPFQRLFP